MLKRPAQLDEEEEEVGRRDEAAQYHTQLASSSGRRRRREAYEMCDGVRKPDERPETWAPARPSAPAT